VTNFGTSSRTEAQLVDDLVDRLAFGAEGDSDEVEILGRNLGDGGAVGRPARLAKGPRRR
jgi:hypothetical protein